MLSFRQFIRENVLDDRYISAILYKNKIYHGNPYLDQKMKQALSMDHADLLPRVFHDNGIEPEIQDDETERMDFVYYDRKNKVTSTGKKITATPVVYGNSSSTPKPVASSQNKRERPSTYNQIMLAPLNQYKAPKPPLLTKVAVKDRPWNKKKRSFLTVEGYFNASKIVPAVRHTRTGEVSLGKKGQWHNDILLDLVAKGKEKEDGIYDWEHGFYDHAEKKYHKRSHVNYAKKKGYRGGLTSPELADLQNVKSTRKDTGKRYIRYKKVHMPDGGGVPYTP